MIDPYRASLSRYESLVKTKLERCKADFGLGGPGKTSLLYLECGNADIMMQQVVPLLPDSITTIQGHDIVCDWCMRSGSKYRSSSPRITFSKFNMNAKYDSRIEQESFHHVILLWDTRWLDYSDEYIANVRRLVADKGMGFFLLELKNTYLDTIIKVAAQDKFSTLLAGIDRQMAPYRPGLNFPMVSLGRLNAICIQYEGKEIKKYTYTEEELKERLEKDFRISTKIPKEKARKVFYKQVIDNMKNAENVIEETVIFCSLYFHRDRSLARL